MSTTITSPLKDFTGKSTFGSVELEFKGGKAETDEKLPEGLKTWLKDHGYGVRTGAAAKRASTKPEKGEDIDDLIGETDDDS